MRLKIITQTIQNEKVCILEFNYLRFKYCEIER